MTAPWGFMGTLGMSSDLVRNAAYLLCSSAWTLVAPLCDKRAVCPALAPSRRKTSRMPNERPILRTTQLPGAILTSSSMSGRGR